MYKNGWGLGRSKKMSDLNKAKHGRFLRNRGGVIIFSLLLLTALLNFQAYGALAGETLTAAGNGAGYDANASGDGAAPVRPQEALATYTFTSPGWATFGVVLPQGKAFDGLKAGDLTTQNDIKNRWPDGSIRYAILTAYIATTGAYPITAATPASGSLNPGGVPGASLSLTIDGARYISELPETVSADLWLDGPLVKEWRVRDIPAADGVAHPFLSNIWDVRIYADGTGTTDVTVENIRDSAQAREMVYAADVVINGENVFHRDASRLGVNPLTAISDGQFRSVAHGLIRGNYIRLTSGPLAGEVYCIGNVASADIFGIGPGSVDATKFDGQTWELVTAHQYGSRWHKVLPLNGFAEAATVTDFTPFIAAGAVPEYLSSVLSGATLYGDDAWQGFDILGFGKMLPAIGTTGGREEIGTYPEWAARYIVHSTPDLREETLAHGDSAGSFAAHYTKDNPAEIVTIDEKPTYWFDSRANSGDKPVNNMLGVKVPFENAHGASLAYVPYLVTGDRYYSDEMLHYANFAVMSVYPFYPGRAFNRDGSDGMIWADQMRGIAWGLRDLTDAAFYLPDASPYKDYFTRIMNTNLSRMDEYAVTADLPLGYVDFGTTIDSGGSAISAPWQNTYFAWALDHAISQNDTDAGSQILAVIVKNVFEPLTNQPGFPAEYAPGYWVKYGEGAYSSANFIRFRTWQEVFEANYRNADGSVQPVAAWWGGHYGEEMRIAAILAKKIGLEGAEAAYDFVMTTNPGYPDSIIKVLNELSRWAIADVPAPVEPPIEEPDVDYGEIKVGPNSIVQGHLSYIQVTYGAALGDANADFALLDHNDQIVSASVKGVSGKAVIAVTAPDAPGVYDVVALVGGKTVAQGSIEVLPYNPNIWETWYSFSSAGTVVINFNEQIATKDKKYDGIVTSVTSDINGSVGQTQTVHSQLEGDHSLVTNVAWDSLEPGTTTVFTIKGIIYPRLYPSYSFTFTATVEKP
jgi:hypothetical protein